MSVFISEAVQKLRHKMIFPAFFFYIWITHMLDLPVPFSHASFSQRNTYAMKSLYSSQFQSFFLTKQASLIIEEKELVSSQIDILSCFCCGKLILRAQFCKLTITNPFGTVNFSDVSQLFLAVGLKHLSACIIQTEIEALTKFDFRGEQ